VHRAQHDPGLGDWAPEAARAIAEIRHLGPVPPVVIRMFCGLRSRWMMPRLVALRRRRPKSGGRFHGAAGRWKGASRRISSFQRGAATYSITM